MDESTALELINLALQDTAKYLASYGDYEFIGDDATDYLPAALELYSLCLEARVDDEPGKAAKALVNRVIGLNRSSLGDEDMDLAHYLATIDFDTPLVQLFDTGEFYLKL